MPNWNGRTYLHAVQFEYEDMATPREVHLCDAAPRVGDPVRIKMASVEVEGRIVEVAHPVLHVRIGRSCSDVGFEETLKVLVLTPPPRWITEQPEG
jgi:hypothetical protein